ncbi:MAG TPA: hypothetical protein VHP37_00040 [Burkholderiales bacterium]|nr:hypothetical protein [Burkholderiales bacterium]
MRAAVTIAFAWALFAAPPLFAAEGKLADVVLSDSENGSAKAVYATTAPKIYLRAKLVDIPKGSKVKAVWIAEKTKVAPPNYEIDAKELGVGAVANRVDFSMSKPSAGWPEGDYRVDVQINGKTVQSVKFKVGG